MLKIRLMQTGKKHARQYRIVVTEQRSKRNGKTTAQIGHWDPKKDKAVLNKKAYQDWLQKGAQPTQIVRRLAK